MMRVCWKANIINLKPRNSHQMSGISTCSRLCSGFHSWKLLRHRLPLNVNAVRWEFQWRCDDVRSVTSELKYLSQNAAGIVLTPFWDIQKRGYFTVVTLKVSSRPWKIFFTLFVTSSLRDLVLHRKRC